MTDSFLVQPGPRALDGDPLVLDVRAAEAFAAGHLPGAVHLDLWGFSLVDTDPAPLAAFLWMVEHVLSLRGVSDGRPVLVYGDTSDIRAARVFWFLDYFGHPAVRFLDGGANAWRAAGLPWTTETVVPLATTWTGHPVRERLATWKDVSLRLGRDDVVMLDTRTDGEYCGTTVRAARGGCIPGAVHVEWTENVGADGRLKPEADLRAMYEAAGVTPDKEVVAYCQGAYRAAHAYVTLRALGYPKVRNYLGSWKEWGDRTELPLEIRG
jgi:thiosulfate/3-mercaptopyruvate sulfurtransferase